MTREVALRPEELSDLRWESVFGDDHPVEVEIGCGKGGFLLRRAQAHPEINLLGIEWAGEFYRYAVDRMRRRGVGNVRVLRADASHFIRAVCPRDSLSALHVYHPDPWPKKRHHKRRLFQQPFVDAAAACLVRGGRLAVQTDHAEYYGQIFALLRSHAALREVDFRDERFGWGPEGLATNFEVKYAREGRPIYQVAVERCA